MSTTNYSHFSYEKFPPCKSTNYKPLQDSNAGRQAVLEQLYYGICIHIFVPCSNNTERESCAIKEITYAVYITHTHIYMHISVHKR